MKSLKAEALIILGITALPRTMGCWKGCPVWITKGSFSSEQGNQLSNMPENTNYPFHAIPMLEDTLERV